MTEIIIKNGYVYDPLNGINGEKMDVLIKNGKIVEAVDLKKAKVIDASGMIIMPGGVDIHSHIAGSKVNLGRLLRPEDHFKDVEAKTRVTRSGVGYSIPSTFTTGYRYARMGYTFVSEPATPPLKARHTHEELNDIPMIDKMCFPLFGNDWILMEYLGTGMIEEGAAYVAWMLTALKGYAMKVLNPGGVEAWGFGRNVESLDESIPHFDITPKEIIRGACKINKLLKLPHAVHHHTINLGRPGNYVTTIESMKCVEDLAEGNKPVLHITHCQFSAFSGDDWATLGSGAEEIAKYVNKHDHVSLDMGQIIFTDTTTMTADGPFQYVLHQLTGNKWVNSDVEAETGAGVVPIRFRRRSYANAIQWAIGLELALLIEDPWRIYLTTDHPNAGPFTEYPRVITWLMSEVARERTMKKMNRRAKRKILVPNIDKEYTLYEIAIITRAGTAQSLGLKQKGHLGIGADADVAIYNIDPEQINLSREYRKIRKAFSRATYTIKDGRIVVKDGQVVQSIAGKTLWVDAKVSPDLSKAILVDLKQKFEEYYTVKFENYPVGEKYLAISAPTFTKADV